jgi:hypothetical protein
LVTFSEQFDNAGWLKGNTTITANAAVSPDGFTNADAIVETATNAEHNIALAAAATTTTSVAQTISVFLKSGTQEFAMLRNFGGGDQLYFCVVVNLNTGTITKTQAGTNTSATASSITSYGNGWYRVTATCAFPSTTNIPILHLVNSATPSIGTFGQNSYLGNGTNSIFAYGFQLENASAYATSYIPTLGASVTRVADAASKTGISSLIGQTEGTIFWEGQISSTQDGQLCDLNRDGNKYIQIYNSLSGLTPTIGIYIQNVSVLLNIGNIATIAFNTNFKFALGYKNNDYAAYLNGVQVYVNTTTAVPPTSNFGIARTDQGAENAGKSINQALLFKTRLTNAQLAELTA